MSESGRCSDCRGGPGQPVAKEEIVYRGSCLGPFKVRNATVWECGRCGSIRFLSSIAKSWEREKAVEIIEANSFFTAIQMRFLRELCGKTVRALAVELDVAAAEVGRWEGGIGGTPGDSRLLARYVLRKEGDLVRIDPERMARIRRKIRMESED